jgi:hypothetical protein
MSLAVAITPTAGLAVASAASAPAQAADVAAIATQVLADVEAATEALVPSPETSPLTAMVSEAATRQESLAPLLADLQVAVNAPALPADIRTTAAQILATQTPLGPGVTADQLQASAQRSGVFFEASLAAAAQSEAAPASLPQDIKALLLQLTNELAPLLEGPAQLHDQPASNAAPRTTASARLAADRPAPPIAGGATAGQPPAQTSIEPDAHVETLARTLQQEAQGALARVQLSQAASVERSGEPARWLFELPIATPDGTAIAQFEISRDGKGPGAPAAEPSWRARFSVNVSPSGPIHADVMLGKGRARITLMAEDADARQALEAGRGELAVALADDQSPDVAVRIVGGAPAPAPQPAGQLLDRRS